MTTVRGISDKVEKFITEGDSFKKAVKECFLKADLDKNGVISPKEVSAMTDTMFDLVEKELNDFGIGYVRPTTDEIRHLLTVADSNSDYVLDENEFFEFYRQAIKYCAVVAQRGFIKTFVPQMAIGLFATCLVKAGVSKVPGVGPAVTPTLNFLPAVIVGPILGLVVAFCVRDGGNKKLQKKLFVEEKKKEKKEKKPAASQSANTSTTAAAKPPTTTTTAPATTAAAKPPTTTTTTTAPTNTPAAKPATTPAAKPATTATTTTTDSKKAA